MGAALGAYGGAQGLASIAGPLLGGLLVTADVFGLGWRAIFWVNVPVGLFALLIGAKVLPESRETRQSKLDLPGMALLAGCLLAVLLPVVQGPSWGWPVWGLVLMVAGALGLAGFVAFERRVAARGSQPIVDTNLLRNRAFVGGLAAAFAFFGGIAAYFLLLSIYLQAGTGRDALATGLITLPYAIGSIITSGAGVKLAVRHGRRLLIIGSLVIAGSHAAMYAVVTGIAEPSWWQLGVPLLIGGLGLGLAAPPLVNVILAAVPAREAGSAGGVLSTVCQIGGSAGVAAFGTVFFSQVPGAQAFAATLPWQVGLYLVAAGLMTLLPAPARHTVS